MESNPQFGIYGQPRYVTDILRDVFKYHRMIHDIVNIRKCSWDFCWEVWLGIAR